MNRKGNIPDMRYINRSVPIADVARALGLRFADAKMIHCWHPDGHQHGDRTASVGIRESNNTVKCFGCDSKPMGPINLVMNVLGLASPADSALWIAARFTVPCIPANKHLAGKGRRGERVEDGLALLIRSGLWSRLSPAAQAIAPVLLEMGERETPAAERLLMKLSYRGIARISGLSSPAAIRRALVELGEIGLILPPNGRKPGKLVQDTARYIVTPFSNALLEMAQVVAQQDKDEIAAAVELRARLRKERVRLFAEERLQRAAGEAAPKRVLTK